MRVHGFATSVMAAIAPNQSINRAARPSAGVLIKILEPLTWIIAQWTRRPQSGAARAASIG